MKPAVKAALLSGLVFPGLGQMYLKRYLLGAGIALSALLAMGIVVYHAVAVIIESLDKIRIEETAMSAGAIVDLVKTHSGSNVAWLNIISLFLAVCWVFSIVNAWFTGRGTERHE